MAPVGNSLKLKFYMYLANKEDVGDEIKAIIDGGELMNSSADDFVFPFYTTPGNQTPTTSSPCSIPTTTNTASSPTRRYSIR